MVQLILIALKCLIMLVLLAVTLSFILLASKSLPVVVIYLEAFFKRKHRSYSLKHRARIEAKNLLLYTAAIIAMLNIAYSVFKNVIL